MRFLGAHISLLLISNPQCFRIIIVHPGQGDYNDYNALCNKSNGRCDIKAEKREELEGKSSHKSDIWPPAASKNAVKYTENIFFRL